MKIAIISDIHGNLEALTHAFEVIDARHVAKVYCLGDIVGYGANPAECIDLLVQRSVESVAGNHDRALFDLSVRASLNRSAREAIEWTMGQLSETQQEFLRNLPYTLSLNESTFVHASPLHPEEWEYLVSDRDAAPAFGAYETALCWIGHTHVPAVFMEDVSGDTLAKGKRSIINVGSIGQPRDHDRRLSFCIFDTDELSVEYIREEYDVAKAREKILTRGLPRWLGDRLLVGV
jgi:diadenosine tetraphosphatase ApaH/serine/threonine PP2A family protein phosphatase